ncbi:MAG: transposase [Acidimicrobiia bacterium]|nr:transposase [Acidimicrobiia bacterium]
MRLAFGDELQLGSLVAALDRITQLIVQRVAIYVWTTAKNRLSRMRLGRYSLRRTRLSLRARPVRQMGVIGVPERVALSHSSRTIRAMTGDGFVTRAVVFPLDMSPSEERLLGSYCGARRFAYNWVLATVQDNLDVRRVERESGVPEDELTPAVPWSATRLGTLWNQAKDEVAPWWREVSMHAFRSGIVDAAQALDNWSKSRSGERKGRRVGFPRFKKRGQAVPSVSFVEINHQLSWLHHNRHAIRLMLPQSTPELAVKRRRRELAWLHTSSSTRRLYRLVEQGRASIQKVTVARRGGRWQASLLVRYQLDARPVPKPRKRHGGTVGVDGGVKHLATLSRPVAGLTDTTGHVINPKVLAGQLRRLRKLDRAVARCEKGSRNRRKLLDRRARLHGRITKTRALHLHHMSNALAGGFDVVAIEDLNLAGMGHRKRRLGRALADASLGELRRQLTYKTTDHDSALVVVGRFFPSSKTCSDCGLAKAKLALGDRTFICDDPHCALVLDRDVNAARNIAREAQRLLEQQEQPVAGLRPETQNAEPRPHKTSPAHAGMAAVARGRNQTALPATAGGAQDLDGTLATASSSTSRQPIRAPRITPLCRT